MGATILVGKLASDLYAIEEITTDTASGDLICWARRGRKRRMAGRFTSVEIDGYPLDAEAGLVVQDRVSLLS